MKFNLVDTLKNIWGSNSSNSFKVGAWVVAGIAFYGSTKLFDERKLSQTYIEQHNSKVLEDQNSKEKK